jgi:hypothetical protein
MPFAKLFVMREYQHERLEKILSAAGRVVFCISKYDHITPKLIELHWLPVEKKNIIQDSSNGL